MQNPRIQVIDFMKSSFKQTVHLFHLKSIIDNVEQHRNISAALDLGPFIAQYPLVPDFQRILSWLYANLSPHRIRNPRTGSAYAAELVNVSLNCLIEVRAHAGRKLYAHITRDLESNWPNIWHCISFVHTQLVENASLEASSRCHAGYPSLGVLILFSSDDHLRQLAGRTPGVIAMLMRLSGLEITSDSQPSDSTHDAVTGLNAYLPLMGQQLSPRWTEEVLAPAGGSAEHVARLVLKRLSFHVSWSSTDDIRLTHLSNKIVHITHLSNYKPIRDAFIAQGSIRLLVNAMESLLQHPLNTESLKYMTYCIAMACNCLRGHIFAIDGIAGIIEAFGANILPTLLRCANMLTTDDDAYFSLLCKDFPKFIIYPSVLRAAKRSLKKFNQTSITWLNSQTARLKRIWEAFLYFEMSMDEIDIVKEAGAGVGMEICGNKMACFIHKQIVTIH
jgi:hypothetical protein